MYIPDDFHLCPLFAAKLCHSLNYLKQGLNNNLDRLSAWRSASLCRAIIAVESGINIL